MWFLGRGSSGGKPRQSPPPLPIIVIVQGEPVAVTLRQHARARRMVLRQSRDGEHFILTVPRRHDRRAAEGFLNASAGWMARTRARLPAAVPMVDGGSITLRGETYLIESTGSPRGQVTVDPVSRRISVPGTPHHLKRRLVEWLRREALGDFQDASRRYALAMHVTVQRLAVRDQKGRWGSCSTGGILSFSWRLVLAPPMVLDYVAAHEVAHLREMNHGPRFWRLVLTHCMHAAAARAWLKQHGQSLHRMA
jgi:hypothetical protein